jgi:4'-phosphopantetheinyl transferase
VIPLPGIGTVHVWEAYGRADAGRLAADTSAMSKDERARANRFIDERARNRFIAGRQLLRHVLADYLDAVPASIKFETSPLGKPRLGKSHASSGLHFNISHSGELILVAIAKVEIGVDAEEVTGARFNDNLIRRVFSEGEQALIESSPDPLRMCLQLWVRKEASVKAAGIGLVSDLASIDVSKGECTLSPANGHSRRSVRCFDLSFGSMYVAAVASSAATDVRRMAWP